MGKTGDVALGLAPQAFLEDEARDVWACFWRAARRVDDAADAGHLPERWQDAVDADPVAADDLDVALDALPEAVRDRIVGRFDAAWFGITTRHGWQEPPPLVEYVRVSALTAGLPLRLYAHLADPDGSPAAAARAADLFGASVQLGDDVRDRHEDAEAGVVTRAAEEPEGSQAWVEQRRAMSAWFLAEALGDWPRPSVGRGAVALGPVLLWHRAIRDGEIRPSSKPLALGVRARPGSKRWFGRVRKVAADVAASPEAARGVLRQDLRHRARGLDDALQALCREAVDGS